MEKITLTMELARSIENFTSRTGALKHFSPVYNSRQERVYSDFTNSYTTMSPAEQLDVDAGSNLVFMVADSDVQVSVNGSAFMTKTFMVDSTYANNVTITNTGTEKVGVQLVEMNAGLTLPEDYYQSIRFRLASAGLGNTHIIASDFVGDVLVVGATDGTIATITGLEHPVVNISETYWNVADIAYNPNEDIVMAIATDGSYSTSDDGGQTWTAPVALATPGPYNAKPKIAVKGDTWYMMFGDELWQGTMAGGFSPVPIALDDPEDEAFTFAVMGDDVDQTVVIATEEGHVYYSTDLASWQKTAFDFQSAPYTPTEIGVGHDGVLYVISSDNVVGNETTFFNTTTDLVDWNIAEVDVYIGEPVVASSGSLTIIADAISSNALATEDHNTFEKVNLGTSVALSLAENEGQFVATSEDSIISYSEEF